MMRYSNHDSSRAAGAVARGGAGEKFMYRFATAAGLLALIAPPLFFLFLRNDDMATSLKQKTITTAPGKVGNLLRQWWAEGTAAGNAGDFYDNRDGGHSDLDVSPYPQLQRIVYSPEDIQKRRNWGAQFFLRPGVVFGNSSTSAAAMAGGSNARGYYVQPAGLAFLYKQYRGNNLYIYPEHRDHDAGHNGPDEGFGDLYPTNTPYLLISQGSSYTDQPFMRAVPFALAAFRPEVKKKLTETGLLMPTLQMLLRNTNRHLKTVGAYITAQAHPTVFEGSWVNELGLVQAAHDMRLGSLPPMVQLKVLEEDQPVRGRDYFEPAGSEKLADTPAVIARIFRGKDYQRRLVISAAESFDVNKKPLSFTWTVLRGDQNKITIKPRDHEHSVVEIIVPYHPRRPIAPGSAMESNRVDIGVFANNGAYYSAPGFITFYTLDDEARTYDRHGRILEIGYGMGETHVTVAKWPAFLEAFASNVSGVKYLSPSPETRALLAAAAPKLSDLEKKATPKELQSFVKAPRPARSLNDVAEDLLRRAVQDSSLFFRVRQDDDISAVAVSAVQNELGKLGLLAAGPATPATFTFLPDGPTAYEKMLIQRANAALLTRVLFPGVLDAKTPTNYVDRRLATPKHWRDVYRHDDRGNFTGWTRYGGDQPLDFNADGLLIVAKDELGRCRQARAVNYVHDARPMPGDDLLRMALGDDLLTYQFTDPEDRTGKVVARDKISPSK
jgi:hypothetical protein